MDETDEIVDLPEGAAYAGKAGKLRTWKASPAVGAATDGKTAKFVLYSGNEVRFHPQWQTGGDIIVTREFKLANYRANPVILADHNPDHVIGRGTASIVKATTEGEPDQLHGAATWDLHESNPLAVLIAGQHARGVRSAVSIGFMPGSLSGPRTKLASDHPAHLDPEKVQSWRAGWLMRGPELYEWSSVSIPKDPSALQLQAWAMEAEDPDERFRRIVREVLAQEHAEWVLRGVRHSTEVRTAIAAVALEQVPNPAPTPAVPADWFEDWS